MTLLKLVKTAVAALEEIKARDIEVLDVTKITTLFDRMIIASGDSTRQTKAIANNVAEKVKAGGGTVYGVEGEQAGEWILVDLGDVLVHVMQSAVRAHYNLEELWAEARKINKAAVAARSKAGVTPSTARRRKAPAEPAQKSTAAPAPDAEKNKIPKPRLRKA
ncbi:ribosome silencing factor [Nitrosovibrio tenuis]|uniref:Ribosomal silencing factor RsfS n=1 Tax=Nitrosovibrio tenuis TaxID=1233 RepID=A0A1H7M1C6_9PROT|nr:ribosome silencing factor [Nitrosovibrio tenuis]SEL04889.1 ribosome-associated protein [Nitrosovibrio tenuis]